MRKKDETSADNGKVRLDKPRPGFTVHYPTNKKWLKQRPKPKPTLVPCNCTAETDDD